MGLSFTVRPSSCSHSSSLTFIITNSPFSLYCGPISLDVSFSLSYMHRDTPPPPPPASLYTLCSLSPPPPRPAAVGPCQTTAGLGFLAWIQLIRSPSSWSPALINAWKSSSIWWWLYWIQTSQRLVPRQKDTESLELLQRRLYGRLDTVGDHTTSLDGKCFQCTSKDTGALTDCTKYYHADVELKTLLHNSQLNYLEP